MIPKIEDVKNLLQLTEPLKLIVNKNLGRAYNDYMQGKIAHGAYYYVLARHGDFFFAISLKDDEEQLIKNLYSVIKIVAITLLDINGYIKYNIKNDKKKIEAEKNVDKIEEILKKFGFTEKSKFCDDLLINPNEEKMIKEINDYYTSKKYSHTLVL